MGHLKVCHFYLLILQSDCVSLSECGQSYGLLTAAQWIQSIFIERASLNPLRIATRLR